MKPGIIWVVIYLQPSGGILGRISFVPTIRITITIAIETGGGVIGKGVNV